MCVWCVCGVCISGVVYQRLKSTDIIILNVTVWHTSLSMLLYIKWTNAIDRSTNNLFLITNGVFCLQSFLLINILFFSRKKAWCNITSTLLCPVKLVVQMQLFKNNMCIIRTLIQFHCFINLKNALQPYGTTCHMCMYCNLQIWKDVLNHLSVFYIAKYGSFRTLWSN